MSEIRYNTQSGKITVEVDGNSMLDWIHLMETCIREVRDLTEKIPEDEFSDGVHFWTDAIETQIDGFDDWREQDAPGDEWPDWFTKSLDPRPVEKESK